MTEQRAVKGRHSIGVVTTAIVAFGAAATVGWAAAVPIGGSSSSTGSSAPNGAATVQTSQQIDAARTNLQHVRHDLTRLVHREDELPRARLANLPTLVAQLPNVQVPQASVQTTHVSAPVTHTTSGASGARP